MKIKRRTYDAASTDRSVQRNEEQDSCGGSASSKRIADHTSAIHSATAAECSQPSYW